MTDTETTSPPPPPTKGLRLAFQPGALGLHFVTGKEPGTYPEAQGHIDMAYINELLEMDERRREHLAKLHAGSQDLLVDMGDMTRVSLDSIRLDADYESMTEDIIQNVNHIILQGIQPIKAIFSMSQAFAIVLGFALRANMPFEVAKALITQVMKSATASEQMVRIITKQ